MQPIFCSFTSGVHYRKTVKRHFRSILPFDLVVSIYENMPFRLFSSFLTAGNKSKCGTLQRLTDPQQSTVDPIFRPMSPSKRQASQRKPFALSSVSAQTSSHLRRHRTSVSPTPHSPSCRNYTPPTLPTPKSHVIPPGPHSSAAQKPRNINDLISNPETSSRELRAKLLSCTRFLGRPARRPPRGLRGLAGLRDDAPGHTPAARRRRCGGRRRVRRARAGFEIDHSEPLGSRVAISRAAGPDGARNTSGTTSNAGDLAGPQPQQAAPRAAAAQ